MSGSLLWSSSLIAVERPIIGLMGLITVLMYVFIYMFFLFSCIFVKSLSTPKSTVNKQCHRYESTVISLGEVGRVCLSCSGLKEGLCLVQLSQNPADQWQALFGSALPEPADQ